MSEQQQQVQVEFADVLENVHNEYQHQQRQLVERLAATSAANKQLTQQLAEAKQIINVLNEEVANLRNISASPEPA